jgi:NAD(P)-dependent dehydrogenase (short-subunit alcohol dehydrogenase family)
MAGYDRKDILVNNIGRSEPGCPATMSGEVWDSQVDINVKSVFLTAHHVLPILEKQGAGVVVSIGNIAGMRYIRKPHVGYSVMKAAIMQFTKATAVIYASKGVRMNAVAPGLMDTPYTKALVDRYAAGGGYEGYMAMQNAQIPIGTMGDSWDVAYAALFLVSDEARYITRQKIVVDGGITSSTRKPFAVVERSAI